MKTDYSYKTSFGVAVLLHVAILIFLLSKFIASPVAFKENLTWIDATAVSASGLTSLALKQEVVQRPQPQPVQHTQMPKVLQQKIVHNDMQELRELKQQMQKSKEQVKKQQEQQLQKVLQEQARAEQQQLQQAAVARQAAAHSRVVQGEIDKYKARVIKAIAAEWIVPDGVTKDLVCKLLIELAPDGSVLNVQLLSSSGNVLLDRSAQTAVLKASPLPVPQDSEAFDSFRTIHLTVRPAGLLTE